MKVEIESESESQQASEDGKRSSNDDQNDKASVRRIKTEYDCRNEEVRTQTYETVRQFLVSEECNLVCLSTSLSYLPFTAELRW